MECTAEEIRETLGASCYKMYELLDGFISNNYNVDKVWAKGRKQVKPAFATARAENSLYGLFS